MEEQGALRMWQRSVNKKLRYTVFIGDGDASSYKALCSVNDGKGVYGEDRPVKKEECINHVHKRMGTALRKLKDETVIQYTNKKGEEKTKKLFGGKDKLTVEVMKKLQDYYQDAIRRNKGKSVKEMSDDIWSTYYHINSTDAVPMHFLCPVGYWCFYKNEMAAKKKAQEENEKASAENQSELGEASTSAVSFYGGKKKATKQKIVVETSHCTMKLKVDLDKDEKVKLKGVYERMTDPRLLERCLMGYTQNPNESFHSRVWQLCPKVKNVGKKTLNFAVAQASINYNAGYEEGYLGKELHIDSPRIIAYLKKLDKRRERSLKPKRRKPRKIQADPNYMAGGF